MRRSLLSLVFCLLSALAAGPGLAEEAAGRQALEWWDAGDGTVIALLDDGTPSRMLDLQFHDSLMRRPWMRAIDLHHAWHSVRVIARAGPLAVCAAPRARIIAVRYRLALRVP